MSRQPAPPPGAFADRYEASRDYDRALAGEVPLEAGWRVYSSGPGLFLDNPYRRAGVSVRLADLAAVVTSGEEVVVRTA